jgi:hypothetical protein
MNAPALTLAQVLPSWMQAKEDERKAIEHRRSLDNIVRSLLPTKDEGTVSQDDGNYKAVVTYKLDRKLDTSALQVDWSSLPPKAQDAIKWKAELSTTAFRSLSDDEKSSLSKYITTKPASPSVSVELKESK